MNAHGAIVGAAEVSPVAYRVPAIWCDGETTLLEVPDPILAAVGACITDSGKVVGSGDMTSPLLAADYLLWPSASAQDLYRYPDTYISIVAANESLTAVGDIRVIGGESYSAVFFPDGHSEPLPKEPWPFSPTDINERGDIVGSSGYISDAPPRALLWTSKDGLRELEAPSSAGANAINDSGTVVGYVYPDNLYSWQACLWKDGHFLALPTPRDFERSNACDINNSGWIVGAAEAGTSWTAAVLWKPRPNGTYEAIDLRKLLEDCLGDCYLVSAISINDNGQILAIARPRYGWDEGTLVRLTPE
jgi:hypothetical protein